MQIVRRILTWAFTMLAVMSLAYADPAPTTVSTSTTASTASNVDAVLQKLKINKDTYICPMAGHTQEFGKPGTCPICGMALQKKYPRLRVGVLVFEGAEEIDYAGPIEAFGYVGADIFTIASSTNPVRSAYDVTIKPDYDIEHAPETDVIVVPGGGIDSAYEDARLMDWLRQRSATAHIVMSVCNGAFILGKAGLLDGLTATTTAGATGKLAAMFPKVHVANDRRYVDNGKIITTAGLTSGIDGALHVIDRERDRLQAEQTARFMEYDWHPGGESGYGARAQFHEPSIAKILPDDATWQYLSDHGDTKQWEITGHLATAANVETLLDAASAQMTKDGWTAQTHAKMLRTFQTNSSDGKWQLTLMLTNEGGLPVYHMSIAVKKVATTKNAIALH